MVLVGTSAGTVFSLFESRDEAIGDAARVVTAVAVFGFALSVLDRHQPPVP
ncbi:MAG: hypothetical protein ABEJ44_03345 [Halanaeroarchaeum sp.]